MAIEQSDSQIEVINIFNTYVFILSYLQIFLCLEVLFDKIFPPVKKKTFSLLDFQPIENKWL